jgi:hypothetical protein
VKNKRQNINCIFQFEEDLDGSLDLAAYSNIDNQNGIDVCILASGLQTEEQVENSLVVLIEDLLACVRDLKARMRKRKTS